MPTDTSNLSTERKHCETLVIGAGVIGLSLAWELARRGKIVTVLDSHEIGQISSSWAGAGILPPTARTLFEDPYEQLRSLSSNLHREWAARLLAETGVDTGYQECGGVYLARSSAERATLLANEYWWEEHGISFERLTRQQLLDAECELSAEAIGAQACGWSLPSESQIRNPDHLRALTLACQTSGVEIVTKTAVADVDSRGGRVRAVVLESGSELSADQVCITAGAWARQLLDRLNIPTGILPVRGQMVLFQTPTPLSRRVINEGNRYLVPRRDGRMLAGSVEEEVGYVCETNEQAIAQIRTWAEELLPALAGKVEKTWAGLRPGSFDGLPYLGRVPEIEELFLASGHFRSGLHLSTGTAVLMADLMCGAAPPINMEPFRVGRG